MKTVITYGTFDCIHFGHLRLLERARALGDRLVVFLSTDEFNAGKGKKALFNYEERKKMLEGLKYVDKVLPEKNWEQKRDDVTRLQASIVVMGGDWSGRSEFENLRDICSVVYLPRTEGISSTLIRKNIV